MITTLIKNCTLIDGSGKSRSKSDVAICGNKIVAIARSLSTTGVKNIINAQEKVLSPGFIDCHTHSDMSILAAPEASGKLSQGVTTDIIGNCGLSVFPVSNLNRDHLNSLYKNYDININWDDLYGYSKELIKRQPAINIATLCGHNTLRASNLGYKNIIPDKHQLTSMRQDLEQALKSGAKGLSTGLLYTPGKFAKTAELTHLLGTLPLFDTIYATHIRSEGDQLIESIEEAIHLAKEAKVRKLHISHLKASQQRNWSKLDDVFQIIKKAQTDGLNITADRYPYTESMTQLSIILPPPYDSMPDSQIEIELIDQSKFTLLTNDLSNYKRERWENTRLANTGYIPFIQYIGLNFIEISDKLNKPPHLICAELIQANSTGTMGAFKGMCPENLKKVLAADYVCCGSDESSRPLDYCIGRSHPRGFGSMPRFIRMHQELGIHLEESIRRITSQPADIFGLTGRGMVATGYCADLVLFDPERFIDTADFTNPHSLSLGIDKVWVNGQLSFDQQLIQHKRSGQLI